MYLNTQYILLFLSIPVSSQLQPFTFLYKLDVKIVKLASLSTLVVVSVEHSGEDVLATQCLLTAAKVLKCGVIHRGQWENCYGRDTKRIKMHQFCITKL